RPPIVGPHAIHRQANRKPRELPLGSGNSQPEVMIVTPGRIEPPDLLEDPPADEGGRLKDHVVAVAKRVFQIPRARDEIPLDPSTLVDKAGGAVHYINIRRAFKKVDGGTDGAWLPEIVGIQPREDLPVTQSPASVDGVECASIGLREPANPVAVPLEEVNGAI